MKHNEVETTFQEHGSVRILTAEGQELVSSDSVQHNKNYNRRVTILQGMAQEADEKFKELN